MKFKTVTKKSDIEIPTTREKSYTFYSDNNFLGVVVELNWYNYSEIIVHYFRVMREIQVKKPSLFKTKSRAISSIAKFLNIK